MPLGEKPIARQTDLFIRRCRIVGPVKIRLIFRYDRPEFFQIKKSVSRLYRFKRPFDELDAFGQRPFTLCPLQTGADPVTLICRTDGGHVRIECLLAAKKCRNAQNKPGKFAINERPESETAGVLRNDKMPDRRDLDLR